MNRYKLAFILMLVTAVAAGIIGYAHAQTFLYFVDITINNSTGTPYTTRVMFPINSLTLINNNYMQSNASDTNLTLAGVDTQLMGTSLGANNSPWYTGIISIPANSTQTGRLYLGDPTYTRNQRLTSLSTDQVTIAHTSAMDITDNLRVEASGVYLYSTPTATSYFIAVPGQYALGVDGSEYFFQTYATITSVTVNGLYRTNNGGNQAYFQPRIILNNATVAGTTSSTTDPTNWLWVSQSLSRPGGGSWRPEDIQDMKVGAALASENAGTQSQLTFVTVSVAYTGGTQVLYANGPDTTNLNVVGAATNWQAITSNDALTSYVHFSNTATAADVYTLDNFPYNTIVTAYTLNTRQTLRGSFTATTTSIYIDDVLRASVASTFSSVPVNTLTAYWQFNGLMDSLNINSGILYNFEPNQVTSNTVLDQIGSTHASVTWAGNPSGVTASVSYLQAGNQAVSGTSRSVSAPVMLGAIDHIASSETINTSILGYGIVKIFADNANIPVISIYAMIFLGIILASGTFIYVSFKTLLGAALIMGFVIGIAWYLGVYPWWVLVFDIPVALLGLLADKHGGRF